MSVCQMAQETENKLSVLESRLQDKGTGRNTEKTERKRSSIRYKYEAKTEKGRSDLKTSANLNDLNGCEDSAEASYASRNWTIISHLEENQEVVENKNPDEFKKSKASSVIKRSLAGNPNFNSSQEMTKECRCVIF